ncbi:MAG: HAMP domain-containing histidine kinase [Sphingobacteriaceae bacterium]|nr:MAG: HAMP domain-containing histidine kinase [Sphingobacteriaceae bacterium]
MNKPLLAVNVILGKRNFVLLPLVIFSLAALILLNYYTIKIISSARAYINGESQYSKGQKDASARLMNYVYLSAPEDYESFLKGLNIPLGDSQARVNLISGNNEHLVRGGFLQGKNHPDDIDGMMWLYHRFHNLPDFKKALQTWKEGDNLIAQLQATGEIVHKVTLEGNLSDLKKRAWINNINSLSLQLTNKEEEFSNRFGIICRKADRYIFICNCFLTLLIFGSSLSYADMMIRKLADSNKEVSDTNEALIQTNSRLDKMVFNVTHDLRAPLATLSGLIDLLRVAKNEQSKVEYLTMMKGCIAQQDEFIIAVLNSKEGKSSADHNCDLVQLVNDIHAQHYLDKSGQPVNFHINLSVQTLNCDPLKLRTVFNNLVSNAIKYFDYEHKTEHVIEIGSRKESQCCIIVITDNGIGIEKRKQKKIFDKYYVSKRSLSSTGLGLYLVKETTKELKGTIEVESEPGSGSTFIVTLPI